LAVAEQVVVAVVLEILDIQVFLAVAEQVAVALVEVLHGDGFLNHQYVQLVLVEQEELLVLEVIPLEIEEVLEIVVILEEQLDIQH
jgi:hypothetical protein